MSDVAHSTSRWVQSFRRVAKILAAAAYVVPWPPHFILPPFDPHHRPIDDGRGACIAFAYALILAAFVAAVFGARGSDRKTYWPRVAAVGTFWFLTLICLTYGW